MSNELMHYGVKGMRWGVINGVARASGDIVRETARIAESRGKRAVEKKKASSSMTDNELRERVSRLNLEKQYSTLSQESISKGRERFKRILDTAGSILAITVSAATIAELLAKNGG